LIEFAAGFGNAGVSLVPMEEGPAPFLIIEFKNCGQDAGATQLPNCEMQLQELPDLLR